MYLKQLTISNYKSFYEPRSLSFEPGFNVLLGANSSGKTTVLEAITLTQLPDTPHRSVLNLTEVESVTTEAPVTELRFSTDVEELCKLAQPQSDIYVGLGDDNNNFYTADIGIAAERLNTEVLLLDFQINPRSNPYAKLNFEGWNTPWRNTGANNNFPGLQISSRSCEPVQIAHIVIQPNDINHYLGRMQSRIYRFSAERTVQPTFGHHHNGELMPNSANLAFCINHLQSNNKHLFETLNSLLQRVFPTIHWVSAPPINNLFELKVHTNKPSLNRGDLAVPINHVGTGVGNALAMLYVALTAQTQRFILLEEPNSFLHPRALRELLAILAEIGSKHQFFITTHSSDVLRTINASTVTLLEHDGMQTSIQQTTGSKLHELKSGLIDVGIRLTDLHGCDEVLWVEGETEEAVFPTLLRYYFPEKAQGIAVLPVVSTGEFESKKLGPKKIAEIYKRLSESSFLAPPMVAIALDKEKRSDEEIEKVKSECGGLVHFLPRTMLEDYFLDADALTFVINRHAEKQVSLEEVQTALANAKADTKNELNPKNLKGSGINAAKILNTVFHELLKSEYKKVLYGLEIAEWLLKNKPKHFDELQAWFAKFI